MLFPRRPSPARLRVRRPLPMSRQGRRPGPPEQTDDRMSGRAFAAVLLVLAGAFAAVPIAVVLGIVVLLLETIRAVWARYGLRGVTYRRALAADRTTWGDEIPMTVEVWNRKRLPLAWLRADDDATFGVVVRERE